MIMIDFKFNNLTEKVVKQMVKVQIFVLIETLSRFWAQNNENGYQQGGCALTHMYCQHTFFVLFCAVCWEIFRISAQKSLKHYYFLNFFENSLFWPQVFQFTSIFQSGKYEYFPVLDQTSFLKGYFRLKQNISG